MEASALAESLTLELLKALDAVERHQEGVEPVRLNVDSRERFETAVQLVFFKAHEEPDKHHALALVCQRIDSADFQQQMVTQCQIEFEKSKKDDEKVLKMTEILELTDSQKERDRLTGELQKLQAEAQKRSLCNSIFVGELYSLGLVPGAIAHECIVRLLRSTTDVESLKCFAKLITVFGKILDQAGTTRVDAYFERVAYIIKKGKIPPRVKQMLVNVQELRMNKWVPITKQASHQPEDQAVERRVRPRASRQPEHQAVERWMRPRVVLAHLSEEERQTAVLFGRFQSILNKLTPQKFQRLAETTLQLEINTRERLKGCIDLIVTRVFRPEEQKFLIAYANLCKVLSTLKVDWEDDGKVKQTNFRRELLNKLQVEFERGRDDDQCLELSRAVENAATPEEKKKHQCELERYTVQMCNRSVGNISFIGELFMLGMLSDTILHECIVRLLRSTSDELSLECFARLMTRAGKELDQPRAKKRINGYFIRTQDIIKKCKISLRTKFILQDVMELRENAWVPRRMTECLRTIDQIHAEAATTRIRTQRQAEPRGGHTASPRVEPVKIDSRRLAALKKAKKTLRDSAL